MVFIKFNTTTSTPEDRLNLDQILRWGPNSLIEAGVTFYTIRFYSVDIDIPWIDYAFTTIAARDAFLTNLDRDIKIVTP